jgi:hypothetical protein
MVITHSGDDVEVARQDDEIRHLKEYRVPANLVHTHLLDLLSHGRRTFDLGHAEANSEIRDMLLVGGRYAKQPDGSLDSTGSTSETLTLASEVALLASRRARSPDRDFNLRDWAQRAGVVLSRLEENATLEQLSASEHAFIREEFLPFLEAILALPPDEPHE